jgi:hypothetical protein
VKPSSAAGLALVLGMALGCGPRGPNSTTLGADEDDAVVIIRCPVASAAVWLDGLFVGELADISAGIAMEAGAHQLELRHDDHVSVYRELTVQPRERQQMVLEMAPRLP